MDLDISITNAKEDAKTFVMKKQHLIVLLTVLLVIVIIIAVVLSSTSKGAMFIKIYYLMNLLNKLIVKITKQIIISSAKNCIIFKRPIFYRV